MKGLLQIEGDLSVLATVATLLEESYPNGLVTKIVPFESDGWDVEAARVLIERIAPRQRALLRLLAADGGEVADDRIRDELAGDGDSLRGITGSITKHYNSMRVEGILPEAAPKPWITLYDESNPAFQRTRGMRMPSTIVDVFRAAFGQL